MPETDCRPVAAETCVSRDLGEELLVYDPDGDQVHVLNEVAREIFLLCDGSRNPADIAAELTERFLVERAQALADVNETLDRLIGLGLLQV